MNDLRHALRSLLAAPLVTAVAVLSLALGIGANTAIFSLVDSLMLRTLPVREPERLALVEEGSWTNPIWEQIRDRRDLFDGAFAWGGWRFDLALGGPTDHVDGSVVSGRYFEVLGVRPILGRGFTEADDRRDGGADGPVAVISYALWQRRFGGALDVIGRPLTLDRVSFTIVGVTPADFHGPEVGRVNDVMVPLGTEALIRGRESQLDKRSSWWLDVMVRLKAGQDIDGATRALRAVQPQIREATMPPDWAARFAAGYLKDPFTLVPAGTGVSSMRLRYQRPLVTLMVVVALVLLIACANIANVLLARATARQHELGVRRALGASRWRLARLLMLESLLISGAGAAVGLLFAQWASRLLLAQLSTRRTQVFLDLSLDWRVLGFTAAAGLVTAVLFGLIPAFRATRAQPTQALNAQSRTIVGAGPLRIGGILVVVQVALSLVLVVAGGLFLRTFDRLANLRLGFDSAPVMVVNVNAQPSALPPAARPAAFEQIRQAAAGAPGVAHAALSVVTPVSNTTWQYTVDVSDSVPLTERQKNIYVNMISPGWFATYGTKLVGGRDFDSRDAAGAPRVAIVNEAFARRFLNGASPIGHTVRETFERPGKTNAPMQIVGVAADAVYRSLRDPVPPTLYLPFAQIDEPPSYVRLSARAAGGNGAALTRDLGNAIARIDPRPSLTFLPLKDYVDGSLAQERILAMLSGFFGGLALLLAGLGLYGVTSYMVGRRRAEIGIRMALGASPAIEVKRILAHVAVLVASGVAIGAVVSAWAVRFVKSLLFGLEAGEPWTLVAGALLLAFVGCAAAWVPARRAARIDPATVLRET